MEEGRARVADDRAGAAVSRGERALQPFSEIAKSDDSNLSTVISTLIKRNVSALMLAAFALWQWGSLLAR